VDGKHYRPRLKAIRPRDFALEQDDYEASTCTHGNSYSGGYELRWRG